MLKISSKAVAVLLAITPTAVMAQHVAEPTPQVAVTRHVGVFGGERIAYRATVAENYLHDASGAPAATMLTIAYLREGVGASAKRPVLFLFNGGPGSASAQLHLALGPRRRAAFGGGIAAGGTLIDNPLSPLDQVDLVFIDPVGTGFSRAFAGVDPKQWYNTKADALATAAVIQDWLKSNHRETSPRYLIGESYGTIRAAAILTYAKPLKFDGVGLIAVVGDGPGNEMPYVSALPTMAAGAWHHGKIDRGGRTVEQVFQEAVDFARTDYASALIQGSSLPKAERRRVAERMSSLIGLSADFIEAHDLRISKTDYMFNLLKDRDLRTGLLDVRVTAPLEPGQVGDIDDPALGVVLKHAPGSPPPSPASVGPVRGLLAETYLHEELKYVSAEPYYAVNFTTNSQWDPAFTIELGKSMATAMKADPKLRLFWAMGYYDLTTPAYATRYTFDQAGVPAERTTAGYFEGPHAVYEGEANLAAFTKALKAFTAGASPPDETSETPALAKQTNLR